MVLKTGCRGFESHRLQFVCVAQLAEHLYHVPCTSKNSLFIRLFFYPFFLINQVVYTRFP